MILFLPKARGFNPVLLRAALSMYRIAVVSRGEIAKTCGVFVKMERVLAEMTYNH